MSDEKPEYGAPSRDLDRDETANDTGAEPDHSWYYRLGHYLVDNLLLVVSALGLLAFVLASVLGVGLPRNLRIMGFVAFIVIPVVGRPAGKRIVSMLWEPSYIWLLDLDAQYQKGGIFRIPVQQFREWSVQDGALDWLTPNLAVGKNVSLTSQTVDGTWRGTYSDRELLRSIEAVKECRGQLEDDAKKGFAIETHAHGIVRRAAKRAVLRLVSTFERGSLPDEGDGLTEEIDTVIEDFGLERAIRDVAEDNSPASDVPGLDEDLDDTLADLATVGRAARGGASADD